MRIKPLYYLILSGFIHVATICNNDKSDEPIRYLALGDSYTIGESVPEGKRWPVQLAGRLKEAGVIIEAPRIIATTGWTTDELKTAIAKEKIREKYDLVSLLIGVNNQYRGYDIENYKREFKELLEMSVRLAGGDASKVFVVSIPDYGVTPFGQKRDAEKIARELDMYNAIANEITEKAGIRFFNITPGSRKAKSDPELVASDGLHPSGKMYEQWVDSIFPEVLKMIGN